MTNPTTPDPVPPFLEPAEAAAVLRWYLDAGVDLAVGDDPVDLTQQVAQAPMTAPTAATPPETPAPIPPRTRAAVAPVAAVDVSKADSLEVLKDLMDAFTECPLRRMATRTVVGNGPADARLMVIGEAPGADEDRSGLPFVGRAGQLLDRMLASIGQPRAEVYVTNVIPWRPPGNRTPTPEEVTMCLPFVLRAIDLVAPDVILLLGGSAASAILGSRDGITRLRGRWQSLSRPGRTEDIPVLATFHPAYLLRYPDKKSFAWQDLLHLQSRLADNRTP